MINTHGNRLLILLTAVCCFLCSGYILSARNDTLSTRRTFFAGLDVRPSYVMPTHGFYNGWNPSNRPLRSGGSLGLQFGVSDGSRGVYQGMGAAVHTFFAHDLLGTPVTIYLFQGAPLLSITESLALGYEWNLGLSGGWKDNGSVTVSPFNVYINVAALFTWRMNGYWDLTFGPEYTHFSNGDTRFPNGGANTINFRSGVRRRFCPSEAIVTERIFDNDLCRPSFAERISYDLSLSGGWRADRSAGKAGLHIFNQAFPAASLSFNPLYSFNGYLAAGPSIDLLYDRSADLTVSEDEHGKGSFAYPPFLHQMSAGLSARAELRMPVFAVNIGIGYGVPLEIRPRSDLKALYGIFSLKAFMTGRLFLNVSYRLSSVNYSHNLLFGAGLRLGR